MKKMATGEFKVHCLKVMDEVQSKRESILITKRGKPVAKPVPVEKEADDFFNFMKGISGSTTCRRTTDNSTFYGRLFISLQRPARHSGLRRGNTLCLPD